MENEEKNTENIQEENKLDFSQELSKFEQIEDFEEQVEEIKELEEQVEEISQAEETEESIQNEEFETKIEQEETLEEKLNAQDEFSFLDAISDDSEEIIEEKKEEIPTQAQDFSPVIEDFEEVEEENNELITVRPVKFQQFEQTPPNRTIKKNLDIMQDVSMHVSVELGRTKSSIREVMEMEEGSIVELEKVAGEQVEIFVNGKLVAKGEVIVIEDRFGVRITSTNIQKQIQ